jgi:hypothetical protein
VIGVHHDGRIGMINYMQTLAGREPYATEIGEVHYAKMAEAAGLKGIRVDDPSGSARPGTRRWPRTARSLSSSQPATIPHPSLERFVEQGS